MLLSNLRLLPVSSFRFLLSARTDSGSLPPSQIVRLRYQVRLHQTFKQQIKLTLLDDKTYLVLDHSPLQQIIPLPEQSLFAPLVSNP